MSQTSNSWPVTTSSLLHALADERFESGFQVFCVRYSGKIREVFSRLQSTGLDASEIDDVSQDFFLHLHRKLPTFRKNAGKGEMKDWIFTVAKNFAIDAVRKKNRRPDRNPLPDAFSKLIGDATYQSLIDFEDRDLMQNVLETAKSRTSAASWEIYEEVFGGKRISEVATKFGKSKNSVKQTVYRVRETMREIASQWK